MPNLFQNATQGGNVRMATIKYKVNGTWVNIPVIRGPRGLHLEYQGDYSNLEEYKFFDWVTDSGNSYAYINSDPSTSTALSNTEYWVCFAEKGDKGDVTPEAEAARDAAQAYAAQLAAGIASPAGTYANLAALIAANPDHTKTYITRDNGHWNYHNGTAFVSGGAYQSTAPSPEVLASRNGRETLTERLDALNTLSTNLFDKSTVTQGYYVNTSGVEVAGTYYACSDYIPVLPSTQYCLKYRNFGAQFDSSKTVISGAGFNSATAQPFTTHGSAAFIRISMTDTQPETQQLNKGATLLPYEPYTKISFTDNAVSQFLQNGLNTAEYGYLSAVLKHLKNPFVRTIIKLIGDSITFGQSGTGWAATGDTIPGTSSKMNVLTATCWANMLYDYVDAKYNKDHHVAMDNENITYTCPNTYAYVGADYTHHYYMNIENQLADGSGVNFSMFGTGFTIIYTAMASGGIVDIYVDGSKVDTLDTYAAAYAYKQEKVISGLSAAAHTVVIAETNTKNASSGSKTVRLEGLIIPKTAQVINWGISGITSITARQKTADWYLATDNFIIIQLGTNDRSTFLSPAATISNLSAVCKYIIDNTTAKPILMSAQPIAVAQETGNFRMEDVDMAIRAVAQKFNMPYISNYSGYLDYVERTGVDLDDLLDGGVHPNDAGHLLMFQIICRHLGLPMLRDGITL